MPGCYNKIFAKNHPEALFVSAGKLGNWIKLHFYTSKRHTKSRNFCCAGSR